MRGRAILVTCLLLTAIVLIFSGVSCRHAEDVWPNTGKKRVLTSFPPIYCFTKNVAGENADVRCMLTLQGPHDFQPTSSDVELARRADLIFINGLGLDEWVSKLLKGRKGNIIELGEAIPDKQLRHLTEKDSHAHDGHDHKHGEHDPHVWLGPPEAKIMVTAIAEHLAKLDPPNHKNYEERAAAYNKELDALLAYGKESLMDKKSRSIVATHDSLHYFAAAFGLKLVGFIQPKAGSEADAAKLEELVKLCKEQDVHVIAVEPQFAKGPAETLKRELANKGIHVELVEVDPLETAPAAAGKSDPDPAYYMQKMKSNIENLAKALP